MSVRVTCVFLREAEEAEDNDDAASATSSVASFKDSKDGKDGQGNTASSASSSSSSAAASGGGDNLAVFDSNLGTFDVAGARPDDLSKLLDDEDDQVGATGWGYRLRQQVGATARGDGGALALASR